MERALGPENVRALHAQCRACGIPLDRWHIVPPLAGAWETQAVSLLADSIQAETGCARRPAEEEAAIALDLNPDTMRSRFQRWFREARARAA
jgi:hypothetical protein